MEDLEFLILHGWSVNNYAVEQERESHSIIGGFTVVSRAQNTTFTIKLAKGFVSVNYINLIIQSQNPLETKKIRQKLKEEVSINAISTK